MKHLYARRHAAPYDLDNHPRLANGLVPHDATVFRLDDGMEPVVAWLDGIECCQPTPLTIEPFNGYDALMKGANRTPHRHGLRPRRTH